MFSVFKTHKNCEHHLHNSMVIPNMMFNMVNPLDANAAAKAFYTFKDTVQAVQR